MSLRIVTGKTGTPHVTSNDVRLLNKAITGLSDCVLNTGRQFAYEIKSNNLIRIYDGVALIQGGQVQIDPDTYADATIENGTSAMIRWDLICLKYERDSATDIESVSLEVLQGTPAASGADPAYTSGDIISGATVAYYPLYRVRLSGISVVGVDKLFTVAPTMQEILSTADNTTVKKTVNNLTKNGASGRFHKRGYMASLDAYGVSGNAIWSGLASAPIPAAYRPTYDQQIMGNAWDSVTKKWYTASVVIRSTGLISMYVYKTGNSGNITYDMIFGQSSSNGLDGRSQYTFYLSGCWLTNVNGV